MSKFYRWGFTLLTAVAVLAGLAVPAHAAITRSAMDQSPATEVQAAQRASAWHCKIRSNIPASNDRGGRLGKVDCSLSGGGEVNGWFLARGERLVIIDGWRYKPTVYLHVDGYGTSRWTTSGEKNLAFPENRNGWVKVCVTNYKCSTAKFRT